MRGSCTRFARCLGSVAGMPALFVLPLVAGCAAFDPVRGHAPEDLAVGLTAPIECRDANRTIDLARLGQPRPSEHLVGPGDTLSVFVESALGEDEKNPPILPGATDRQQPRTGFPIVVRRDGTIRLPYLDEPLSVAGRGLADVEEIVRAAFVEEDLVRAGAERIIVQLVAPRTTRVLVVRRDRVATAQQQADPNLGPAQGFRETQGSSQLVELRAFENDVLHALAATGGLPGPSAENAVYIMRAPRHGAIAAVSPMTPRSLQPTPAERPAVERPAIERSAIERSAVEPVPAVPVPGVPASPVVPAVPSGESPVPLPQPVEEAARGPVLPVGFSFVGERPPASCLPMQAPCDLACDAGCDAMPSAGGIEHRMTNTPIAVGHSVFGHNSRAELAGPLPTAGHSVFAPAAVDAARVLLTDSPSAVTLAQAMLESPGVVRIPLEVPQGAPAAFSPDDILLHDGDVVYIESRERDFFYTAGLLGGGKYQLPRGESLDVLDALALVDSQRRPLPGSYVGGVSSVSQDVTVGASRLVIYRKLGGRTVPIELNLNRIKKSPSEAITIRPGDRLFLQYTAWEAVGAAFERHFLEGSVLGLSSAAAFSN